MTWEPTIEQQAIINHDITRHARILAGPGTGKSATVIRLMERVDKTQQRGILLTFTRAAKDELRQKVEESDEKLNAPSTIHSFAISQLIINIGQSGLPKPIRLADDWETKNLIRMHLSRLTGFSVKMIEKCEKEMASNWESLEISQDPNITESVREKYLETWETHRKIYGYSLLSELPYRFLELLKKNPQLDLRKWNYCIVDEYQDLNACDLSLLNEMTKRGLILIGVGDDDQSIYSFRKAHPKGLQEFRLKYPDSVDYELSISHRCPKNILCASTEVINKLSVRPPRQTLTSAARQGDGDIRYLEFSNENQENVSITNLVNILIKSKNIPPGEIIIMFRSDHNYTWSKPLYNLLKNKGIPVVNRGEIKEMMAEEMNRKLIAMARLVNSQDDSLSWWTLLNLYDGIGDAVINHFYERARNNNNTLARQLQDDHNAGYPDLKTVLKNKVEPAVSEILKSLGTAEIDKNTPNDYGWGKWLIKLANILELHDGRFAELLCDLDMHIDKSFGLKYFLNHIQPIGEDIRSSKSANSVRLMTMTNSKGLTVRSAIIIGVEQYIIPLEKPDADVEEERRLLYVAMTRATEHLIMTWAKNRTGPTARTGKPGTTRSPSPFLSNIIASENGREYIRSIGG